MISYKIGGLCSIFEVRSQNMCSKVSAFKRFVCYEKLERANFINNDDNYYFIMVAWERMIISGYLIVFFTILFFIAMYHVYMFGAEGGFTNSISVRLLIAGTCFNCIVFLIVAYLVLQVRLMLRLIEKIQNWEEKPRPLKEKILQSLRGRSTSTKTKRDGSKFTDWEGW